MLRLRMYKKCDAEKILSWCKDELTFRRWTLTRYNKYPITKDDMNDKYFDNNGDCTDLDNFYPMTALDDDDIIGHFIMRFVDKDKQILRFGFVIVDDSKRGMGYGKEMLKLGLKYAFEIMKVKKVTIGVLDNNPNAYKCYKKIGFNDVICEYEKIEICGNIAQVLELELKYEDYILM